MDHVHSEKDRNTKTRLLYGDSLYVSDLLCTLEVEKTSYFTLTDSLGNIAALCLTCDDVTGNRKVQLSDLLLDSHLAHEVIDELVHLSLSARA